MRWMPTYIGCDYLEFNGVVTGHTMKPAQDRMSAALDISTGNTDGVSRSSYNHCTLGPEICIHLMKLDAGAKSSSLDARRRSSIIWDRGNEVIDDIHGFQLVGEDLQRSRTRRAAEKIMPGILDDQLEIMLRGKIHRGLDVLCGFDLGGVKGNTALSTRDRFGTSHIALLILGWPSAPILVLDGAFNSVRIELIYLSSG